MRHTLCLAAATLAAVLSGPQVRASTSTLPNQGQPGVERAAAPRAAWSDFVPIPGVREASGRLIVRPRQLRELLATGLDLDRARGRRAQALEQLGRHRVLCYVPQTDEYIVELDRVGDEEAAASALLASGAFEYAEPDWLLAPGGAPQASQAGTVTAARQPGTPWLTSLCPDDPGFGAQWHHQLGHLNSCLGWPRGVGKPSISVAICDTGLNAAHEDMNPHRREGYNAVDMLWESEGGQVGPVHPHGTRMVGTATADGNNGIGVTGVAWNLGYRMVRVSNQSNGNAFLSDLQHGARTAIEAGDRVANVSYAGVTSFSNKTTATYVKSLGGLLVWIAGNSSASLSSYGDRDLDDLIVVGATDVSEGLGYLSNYGLFVDLMAPGIAIYTTNSSPSNGYYTGDGTSYSAPMVTALAGMLWSERPNLTPSDVEALLKAGCADLGTPGVDDVFGYGRIDLGLTMKLDGTAVPHADFAAQPPTGGSPLSVAFRDLSTGIATAWSWDFGDGTTSTEQNPTHLYTSAGIYPVSMTASNALGSDTVTKSDYVIVDLIPPVPEFTADLTAWLSPLAVTFTDLSTGGPATTWSWDFGDGNTSGDQNPTHVYTSSGIHSVSMTASNPYGSASLTKPNYVAVDFIPPVAGFSGTPTTGSSPFVVDFTDESTGGAVASWSWTFGDGYGSTLQNPQHTYIAEGLYTVSLQVTNAWGSDTLVRTGYVDVGPGPSIVADFTGTPTTGTAPLSVDFTDLSIGDIAAWDWDFGDGNSSSAPNPTHVYTVPGVYSVSLQVDDVNGKDDALELEDYILVQ